MEGGDLMKVLVLALVFSALCSEAFCAIKWVKGYSRRDGSYVSGAYRDTSGDGNPYNNANYNGYNN